MTKVICSKANKGRLPCACRHSEPHYSRGNTCNDNKCFSMGEVKCLPVKPKHSKKKDYCEWVLQGIHDKDYSYRSNCARWYISRGFTIKVDKITYCPFCGLKIKLLRGAK